jgi:hypothetical protein
MQSPTKAEQDKTIRTRNIITKIGRKRQDNQEKNTITNIDRTKKYNQDKIYNHQHRQNRKKQSRQEIQSPP